MSRQRLDQYVQCSNYREFLRAQSVTEQQVAEYERLAGEPTFLFNSPPASRRMGNHVRHQAKELWRSRHGSFGTPPSRLSQSDAIATRPLSSRPRRPKQRQRHFENTSAVLVSFRFEFVIFVKLVETKFRLFQKRKNLLN